MASQRPHPITERALDAPLLTFDPATLLAQIKGEDTWQQGPSQCHDAAQRTRATGRADRHARQHDHSLPSC